MLAGTFNIYIIRPDWLGKVGLLPEASEVRFESQMNQPGFRLKSPGLGSTWLVSPNKLVLQTDKTEENCGHTVDRILEILPWTPLMALGCNFAFRGQSTDIQDWDVKSAFPSVANGFRLKQRSWHIGIQEDDQLFNLQLSEVEDHLEIRANVHTELNERDIDFARETARQFMQLRAKSVSLIETIFQARFENVVSNQC